MGRFLQTDPIGYGDGPNIYAYVHGDPVNGSDPSGQMGIDFDEIFHELVGAFTGVFGSHSQGHGNGGTATINEGATNRAIGAGGGTVTYVPPKAIDPGCTSGCSQGVVVTALPGYRVSDLADYYSWQAATNISANQTRWMLAPVAAPAAAVAGIGLAGIVLGDAAIAIPEGSSLFWTGAGARAAAQKAATTAGAEILDVATAGLSEADAAAAIDAASLNFAQSAKGVVYVFQGPAISLTSTWARIEYPALMANPNVTSIVIRAVGW